MAHSQRFSGANTCPSDECAAVRRGVVFENTGRFELAEADYKAVIAAAPSDPSAWCDSASPILWKPFSIASSELSKESVSV